MQRHKPLTASFAAIYFILTVLLHEQVSRISVWLEKSLTLRVYNGIVAGLGIIFLTALSVYIIRKISKATERTHMAVYLFITLILILIYHRTLLVVNAEYIHIPQYAVLSIPVFALTRRFGSTVFWITLLGAIDEAYQYFMLYPTWKYFDFNDVVLNLLGGGIGVILIYTLVNPYTLPDDAKPYAQRGWMKSPSLLAAASILFLTSILYISGYIQLYPDAKASKAKILLSRTPPQKVFWVRLDWGKYYHILTPVEGIVLSGLLTGLYSMIDYRIRRHNGRKGD